MAKLILVRHGESELNTENIFFGHLNPSLTSKGKHDLCELKSKLSNYDIVYCSPLKRTIETATLLNHQNSPIIFDDRLKEINFGIFEGLTYNEICQSYPLESKKWISLKSEYKFINGESLLDLSKRVQSFVEEIKNTDKTYLIITHSGVINVVLSIYLTENLNNFWKFKCKLASMTVLEFVDNYPVLEFFSL